MSDLVEGAFANAQIGKGQIVGIRLLRGPIKMWGMPVNELHEGRRIVVRHDARGQPLNPPIVYEVVSHPRFGVVGEYRGFATDADLK